tara:strand:+ start:147 stop:368 length:222 start_codon:yes stop_codon:yes gene_type:complete
MSIIEEIITYVDDESLDILLSEDQTFCWVTVDSLCVCVQKTDKGVEVNIYGTGQEFGNSIASAHAFFTEAEEE